MTDVFISYSSEDRERVRSLVTTLERGGWDVWWDRQIDAGVVFDREIEKAIDEAKCIIVVWSSKSVESEWVRTEAGEGLEKGNLVPIMIEDVKPPLAFRRIQTIDFSAEEAFDQIREAISRFATPSSQDTSDQTPFVSRELEKARAEEMLDRIGEKQGKSLIISGEAGVGKTRLTKELGNYAAQKDYLVLTGHCLEMDGAPPYQPLLEQIAQVSRMFSPEVLRASLGENAPEVAKLMPELRQQFSDIKASAELPPEQERRYLLNGVGDFIERGASPRPIVLVFEDLHWADDSTCILLRHLTDRFKDSPVMIIGTYRDDELESSSPFARTLQELNRERLIEEINLKRLGKEGVQQIIEGRARKKAPAELVDLVYTETEGNPFFVEEVFRHLEEEGKLYDESGEFMAGVEIADTEVPRGLRMVIVERLERVSEICRKVLTIAAVVGRNFSFDLMLSVNQTLDEDDVLDALEEAETARLIEDLSKDREARYGFVHEQIRQTLLMNLSFPRRQRTHLRIAGALEELYGANSEEHAGELSYHLYQAGSGADSDKTARYLMLAGERALRSLAFEDALKLIDSAMEVAPDASVDSLSKLFIAKAAALCGMGRIDDSLESYSQATDLIVDELERDDIILKRCKMLLDVWRGNEAVEDLEQLLARKKASPDRARELEALRWMSRAYYVMSLDTAGYAEKALASYDQTVQLARELGNERTLGQALTATAQFIDYNPEYFSTAQANLNEAQEIGQRTGDEDVLIEVATARLNTVLSDENDMLGEETLTILLSRKDPIRLNAHYFRMMWSTLGAARFERCVEICDAGTELAYRIGTLPVQYPTIKAFALLALGRFDDALHAISEEVADDDHRFGAALQKLAEFQYLLDCAAFDEALSATAHVIAESKYLSRTWMLGWIANSLAAVTPYLSENQAKLARTLISDTNAHLRRPARAALALSDGDVAGAVDLMSQKTRNESVREVRRLISTQEQFVFILVRANEWQAARAELDISIPLCREVNLRTVLLRLLALSAQVESAIGREDIAGQNLAEARLLHKELSESISNPDHKNNFLTGSVAQQLQLV